MLVKTELLIRIRCLLLWRINYFELSHVFSSHQIAPNNLHYYVVRSMMCWIWLL